MDRTKKVKVKHELQPADQAPRLMKPRLAMMVEIGFWIWQRMGSTLAKVERKLRMPSREMISGAFRIVVYISAQP